MLVIKKTHLITCKKVYKSALFKDCKFVLSMPKTKSIVLFNPCLKGLKVLNTCHAFNKICCSKCFNEYYATKEDVFDYIFVLDKNYNEIDKIKLKLPNDYYKELLSISYDYNNCKIILTNKKNVFSVTTQGDFIKDELSKSTIKKISFEKKLQINKCCQTTKVMCPKITCCVYFCSQLYISYIIDSSLYVSSISDIGNIIDTYFIDDFIFIESMFEYEQSLCFLVTKKDDYSYIYFTDLCCCKTCDITDDCECRLDCECDNVNCCDEIICSIASMENSLSCILNSEGKKLQNGIKLACSVDELLKLNCSVSNTITDITFLETVLYNKLKLVTGYECKKD
ncbi:MAG: hypothetical protein R3Y21_05565 [Mycoplasmatota bacterium]